MALPQTPEGVPADLPAAVEAAAEAMVLLWGRAEESVVPRVSPSQLRALIVVEQHDGINLGRLAERLGAIPSAASRLCDRLQAAGLLDRRVSAVDRREIALVLTRAGRVLLTDLRDARRANLGRVLDGMDGTAREALLQGLTEFRAAAVRLGDRPAVSAGRRGHPDGPVG